MNTPRLSPRSRLWERDRTSLFLGVAVAAILLVGVLSALTLNAFNQSITRVEQARNLRFDLEHLLSLLEEAQRSQRGYVITGEERSLEPYAQARSRIESQLQKLRTAMQQRPRPLVQQMDTIAGETREVLAEIDEAVEIRRTLGFEAAIEQVQRGEIRPRFEALTQAVQELQEAEEAALWRYEEEVQQRSRWAMLGTLILGLLSIGAFSSAAFRLRKAQRALSLSHSHLEGLIEGTSDLISALDNDFRLLAFNSAYAREFERHLGFAPAQGMDLLEATAHHPRYAELVRARWSRALAGETYTLLQEIPDPEGTLHHYETSFSLIRNQAGRQVGAASRTRDVTERIRLERELREHEAFLESIYNGTEALIFVVDVSHGADGAPELRYSGVNATHQRLTGFGPDDLVGKRVGPIPGYLSEEAGAAMRRHLIRCARSREVLQYEEMIPFRDREMWWLTRLTPLLDEEERVYRIVGTALSITDRKKAEEALRRSKVALERSNWELERTNRELASRNRELQDFAYVASHDLQEPLRKIRAFADLLAQEYRERLDAQGQHYLQRIDHAAARMSTLITDLLAFSRVMTRGLPFEPVDLNEVLEGVLSDLEVRLRETGGLVEAHGLCTIEADPTQMRQLLQNLVGNALKFHRKGVPPHVHISATVEPHAEFSSQPTCCITVGDNGIGFEQQHADRIFTPFQRLHGREQYEGTGMGLAICRRIVERHNGTIRAVSQPGLGTVFTVMLPVRQVLPASAGGPDAAPAYTVLYDPSDPLRTEPAP